MTLKIWISSYMGAYTPCSRPWQCILCLRAYLKCGNSNSTLNHAVSNCHFNLPKECSSWFLMALRHQKQSEWNKRNWQRGFVCLYHLVMFYNGCSCHIFYNLLGLSRIKEEDGFCSVLLLNEKLRTFIQLAGVHWNNFSLHWENHFTSHWYDIILSYLNFLTITSYTFIKK